MRSRFLIIFWAHYVSKQIFKYINYEESSALLSNCYVLLRSVSLSLTEIKFSARFTIIFLFNKIRFEFVKYIYMYIANS